ncbi:hypothetical protein SUGI_0745080 [Cryptomeria japonica]|uniref:high mobility group B protein 13 n=1 Tax=Cryptomeria japonica TaxID=3369 RepID=UPI0024149F3A|nr:high mobility group B protein 13 [Cryptomeria japonica]GLJ36874.1 hypothetical protein SUGI_0745080 [Cryptomeria japonica]
MKATVTSGGIFQRVYKNVAKLIQSGEEEVDVTALRSSLQQLKLEKERTDVLLKRRETRLSSRQTVKPFTPLLRDPLDKFLLRASGRSKKHNATFPSPYKLWFRDHWNRVKAENPNISSRDLMVILGEKWKAVSAEEKKPYEEKCESENKVHEQEKREIKALKILHEQEKQKAALDLLQQYVQYRKDADANEKSKRREKDSAKPKKAITAYIAFCNERRAALLAEMHDGREILKMLGREWKNMSREKRYPYEQIAAEAKEHYEREIEMYKQKKNEEANSIFMQEEEWRKVEREQALKLLKKKEKEDILRKGKDIQGKTVDEKKQQKEKSTDPNRPKKPPTSYILFRNETRKNLLHTRPGISSKTIDALIYIKWKELGDAERQMWKDQASSAMVQYKRKIEEYNKKME